MFSLAYSFTIPTYHDVHAGTDGSAVFTLRNGGRPHDISISINFPNREVTLTNTVRSGIIISVIFMQCTSPVACRIYQYDQKYSNKAIIITETTDVCWVHLINEGLTVVIEENGSASVTVQFQGTGPATNSPPRIQEFECTLSNVTEDNEMNEIFKRSCKHHRDC